MGGAARPPARVDVFCADMRLFEPCLPALAALLDAEERRRADGFLARGDAQRFMIARANLRRLLAGRDGLDPRAIRFAYGAYGKPRVDAAFPGTYFNLSHSGDLVLYVLSPDCPDLGIDVERQRELDDLDRLASRVLTTSERIGYESLDASERQATFYRAWTRKEALAKACGEGLRLGFGHFEVSVDTDSNAQVRAIDGDTAEATQWRLLPLCPRPGYAGALAARAPAVEMRTFDLLPGHDNSLSARPCSIVHAMAP